MSDEEARRQQAAAEMEFAQLVHDGQRINERGAEEFGPDYDDSRKTLGAALGTDDACNRVVAVARELNRPHVAFYELGKDEETAREFAKLSPIQQAFELKRVHEQKAGSQARAGGRRLRGVSRVAE
jgi:hypothetical protein